MYNYRWPETPVPTAGRPRFPASTAFLETPSIMTSFRGPKEMERAVSTRVENNFPRAFTSFLPSNLNSSNIFDGNTSLPLTTLEAPPGREGCNPAASKPDSKASLRIVSGTIEHILKIIREQPKTPLLLETVASVLAIRAGSRATEKVLLLRNRNVGPVLQAVFYEIDTGLTPLAIGDRVRCVGRLQTNGSRFQILKITHTTDQYERAIVRLQTVSTFTSKVMR
ncbi:uncharacterized protein LOC131215903 [Anopheles bellator]|uniref:uncharacterized protein LOC131215903 n=1 Tax=Anopheles bellator TaxID=139047 RepID=UPI0026495B49|nr:uncharacterized protein LOC131215903 [Anopheles bellator]